MFQFMYYIAGWVVGVIALRLLVMDIMLQFIRNENAVAILFVCIICVFTVVSGVVAYGRNK